MIGTGSTNFSSGSLVVVVITPPFLDLRIVVMRKEHHIWDTELEYIQPCRGHCPIPARYFQVASTVFQFSKDHTIALSSQLFQGDEKHGNTGEFYGYGPIVSLHSK